MIFLFTSQSHNRAEGDIVGGDKYDNSRSTVVNFSSIGSVNTELNFLYDKLRVDGQGDSSGGEFSEKLLHYMGAVVDGDVRGLEAKLTDSGRKDLLLEAMKSKEKIFKKILRFQTSKTAQRIFTIVLTDLHAKFTLIVTPVIQEDGGRVAVDGSINVVVQSTGSILGENILEFDSMDLIGMLYFLGGNCHIRWDKC
ncbi:ABC-three component system protein [Delftia sp. HK171]|uniref:ABC-three component system protein n=1 Tax=Delftia sp. HK171 TaxID=1920191 RepID=UPI001E2C0FC6|nr:ABC-three component system protein [Delftia sp. HK171]